MSIDPNISGFVGVQSPVTNPTVNEQAKKVLFLDELSPAEKKELLELIYAAQNPVLIPPNLFVLSSSDASLAVGMLAADSKHETIMKMLDSWIDNIQKIKEESERADLKRMLDGISIAFHSYQHSVSPSLDHNFPTFSVGVVLGAIGVHQAIASTPLTHVAMNPIVDMATTAVPLLTGDMRAELGLIGTLVIFGYGLQYGSVASQARADAGQKFDEKAYARNFAEQVLSTLSDDQFNAYLLAIVSQSSASGQPLTDESKMQSIAFIKLVLLASALGALYTAEAGKMSGQEFVGMISGEVKLGEKDFKNQFVDGIRHYLDFLSPDQRAQFYESMMAYFDKEPSIKTLSEPSKAFADMSRTLRHDELQA